MQYILKFDLDINITTNLHLFMLYPPYTTLPLWIISLDLLYNFFFNPPAKKNQLREFLDKIFLQTGLEECPRFYSHNSPNRFWLGNEFIYNNHKDQTLVPKFWGQV